MTVNKNTWGNKSLEDWENWLNGELIKAENVYKEDPDRLISSYNSEQSHIKDYHGRELLELIQNADDAGINFTGESKEKYYLYRIYEPTNGEFELVELSDPLDEDSKKLQFEINPFQCEKTQRWKVINV